MNKNMTALVSCFARAYHSKNYKYKIFDDFIAPEILSKEEYDNISTNMINGIKFFNKDFEGSESDALRYIVDNQLSPSVLGRSIYAENKLNNEIKLGTEQYLIFASGYDTYAYRNNNKLDIYEIDKENMIEDKINRLNNAKINHSNVNYISCDFTSNDWIKSLLNSNYKPNKKSFCSLLGISYYLTKDEFINTLEKISNIIVSGSTIVFDYPTYNVSVNQEINEILAKGSNEEMKSKYSILEIEQMLEHSKLLLYENLEPNDMTQQYFYNYNTLNPNNNIIAPSGVNYCLAVKK